MEEAHWKHLSAMSDELFRELMEKYGQDVWNVAFVLTKSRDLADDIAQDVFLSAYRNIDRFRGESSIKTWLLTIARNTAINYRRTAFFRKVSLMPWIDNKGSNPSAERLVMERTAISDLWQAVMKLPVKFREVLLLHVKYEMPLKDIAKLLDVSEGTVKSRLSRARQKVAVYWKEAGASYERV
ncbi:RNA polymerase sigma factor [Paenibacillus methanolicus]|uniref:RNA polymerase sigma factor n=1 Tax=Paenibacillus methanolicus TaxID=582686 RepID=A0A5S5C6F3_9BACL|nr:sigma-70 family RNA polymerase sigma factor [Paenibacillus methanolicus]TYP74887.1 RNA polymerase sigma-70 factor (ECF subfamily) [Paenibacillus methanolicus]